MDGDDGIRWCMNDVVVVGSEHFMLLRNVEVSPMIQDCHYDEDCTHVRWRCSDIRMICVELHHVYDVVHARLVTDGACVFT